MQPKQGNLEQGGDWQIESTLLLVHTLYNMHAASAG